MIDVEFVPQRNSSAAIAIKMKPFPIHEHRYRQRDKRIAKSFKWIAVISALVLFLFWGAFFCEHIFEWFIFPGKGTPPVSVWISMILHLLMLIGLGMIIKWGRAGSLITVIGTVTFFSSMGYHGFPYIALINALPVFFIGAYRLIQSRI